MNTRTYPRTLNQAFPKTAEYGAAIERPAPLFARSRIASAAIGYAATLAVIVLAVMEIVGR